MKVSNHFYLTEFIPKAIYDQFGERSLQFIDERIITIAQFVRDRLNKSVTINNWFDGGQYNESGFRHPRTSTGGELSQHKHGRAIDIKVKDLTAHEVYDYILKHEADFIKVGVRAIENILSTPIWVHLDCRNTRDTSKILIVNP